MKRHIAITAALAATLLFGAGSTNAQPATEPYEPVDAPTSAAATGTEAPATATEAVAVNNGAPVKVYWSLAGEYLVLSEDIKLWQFVHGKYADINGKQVPEAISELAKKDQDSVKSVTALFASTARFAKTKGKEYSEQLSLLIGFEVAMKQLGCFRSNEADLAQTTNTVAEAQAEAEAAQKAVDDLQRQIDAKKADPQFARVESLRAEIAQLKDTIALRRAPQGTTRQQFTANQKAAKDALPAKEDGLAAEEARLAPIKAALATQENLMEVRKASLADKSKVATEAEKDYNTAIKATTWSCNDNADQTMSSVVEQFIGGPSVSKPEYAAAAPFIKKAKEASDSNLRVLNVWAAISRLKPTAISFLTTPSDLGIKGLAKETDPAKVSEGDPRINLSPDGARVDVASKPGDRVFAFEPSFLDMLGLSGDSMIGDRLIDSSLWPWWNRNVPPIRLMFSLSYFRDTATDSLHSQDYQVYAKGWSGTVSVGIEPVLKRFQSVILFAGLDVGFGFRAQSVREETETDSINSTSTIFSTTGRLGVNFADWVSIYSVGSLRLPLGGGAGVGAEITGLGPARFAIEYQYDLYGNKVNTGVPRSDTTLPRGSSLVLRGGLVF